MPNLACSCSTNEVYGFRSTPERQREIWDELGKEGLEAARRNPKLALQRGRGIRWKGYPALQYVLHELGDPDRKDILDIGCGLGEDSILLASKGALVWALDISPVMVEWTILKAKASGLESRVNARVMDAQCLEFGDESFDFVLGNALLHHLTYEQGLKVVGEVHRTLRAGGSAYFLEPVANSKLFESIKGIIPAGARPSRLCFRSYKRWLASRENWDRPLTSEYLSLLGHDFENTKVVQFDLFGRFSGLFHGPRAWQFLRDLDASIFSVAPWVRKFGGTAVVRYAKSTRPG